MKRNLHYVLAILLLCVAAIHAQTDASKNYVWNVEFSTITIGKALPEILYKSDGASESIALPAFKRSRKKNYTGEDLAQFYEPLEVTEPGAPDRRLIGNVRFPLDTDRVLLLFFPRADFGYNIVALPESDEDFPAGRARLVNVTPYRIAVQLGSGKTLLLNPGEQSLLSGNGKTLSLRVAMKKEEEEWKEATSNIFSLRPETRRTIFLCSSSDGFFKSYSNYGGPRDRGPIQLFSITD